MAYSITSYTGDGSTRDFTVPFSYLNASDVHVYVDTVEVTFTFLSTYVVRLTNIPAAATVVRLQRLTSKTSRPVDFADGSVLLERDLDTLTDFALYVAQEAADVSADVVSLTANAGASALLAQAAAAAAALAVGGVLTLLPRIVHSFTATAGQTVFTLPSGSYIPATSNIQVFIDGIRQPITSAYAETSTTVVTFTEGVPLGCLVTLVVN